MKTFLQIAALTMWVAGSAAAEDGNDPWFASFAKGRYWLYDGTVTFVENGQVKEKKITGWRSEVVDVVEGKGFKAALLKGHPGDLAWYQEGKERGYALLIFTVRGELHEVTGEVAGKFATIKASGELPADLIGNETILCRFPAKADDRFGDPEQTKLGPRYCWVVLDASTDKLDPAVRGLPPAAEYPAVTLTHRTNPDHTNFRFVAGVGITLYEYGHHGTKGDCEMDLVETGVTTHDPAGDH